MEFTLRVGNQIYMNTMNVSKLGVSTVSQTFYVWIYDKILSQKAFALLVEKKLFFLAFLFFPRKIIQTLEQ